MIKKARIWTLFPLICAMAACGERLSSTDGAADGRVPDASDVVRVDAPRGDVASSDGDVFDDGTAVDGSPDATTMDATVTDAVAMDATGSDVVAIDGLATDGSDAYDAADAGLAPPRQIAPLSTATVTSRRPTLRWQLSSGVDGAHIELCRHRACAAADVTETHDVTGDHVQPTADLAPGVWYWRLRGTAGGVAGTRTSPVWQFYVGSGSAAVDTSWGSTLDVNGDGFADVAIAAGGLPIMSPSPTVARVRVYLGSAAGIATTPAVTLDGPDGVASGFGAAIASAGDVNGDGYADLQVGAPYVDLLGCMQAGRVYVYFGGAAGLDTTPHAVDGYTAGGCAFLFGQSVANAGDVDRDGYADIVVGSYSWIVGGGASGGHAYVYRGSATGTRTSPSAVLTDCGTSSGFNGTVVSGAGDVDGDGFGDVAVGADEGSVADPLNTIGVVCVHRGGATGVDTTPAPVLLNPDGAGGRPTGYGGALAASDVNGDGYADLVVGAPNASIGTRYYAGRVFVYQGSATGTPATPTTTLDGPVEPLTFNERFGYGLVSAGDVDNDGYGDLVIGAAGVEPGGRVYIERGSATGIVTPAAGFLDGPSSLNSGFGVVVAGLGDIDRDGFVDIAVTARHATVGGLTSAGTVRVYMGRSTGFSDATSTLFNSPDGMNSYFGVAIAGH